MPVGRYYTIGRPGCNTVREPGTLSFVNRSLRQEILPVFYGNTEFILSFSSSFELGGCLRWLQQLDNRKCSWIHDLTLILPSHLQVHVSSQPNMLFERSGVKIFCSLNPAKCGWACRQCNHSEKIEVQAKQILDSIKPTPGSDSGLRKHHIARLIRVILKPRAFDEDTLKMVKKLSDLRRKRT